MIKVYVDWGVMSQIKQGAHQELLQLLKRKQQLFVVYSTSHISDILVSHNGEEIQNERISGDLDFITELTGDWCAHIAEKKVVVSQRDPHLLFADRVSERDGYGDEGPLAYALKLLEPGSAAHEALQTYLDSPLPDNLAPAAGQGHYPGLDQKTTLGNLMKISWMKNKKLAETEDYNTLRTTVQQGMGINKDKMFAKEKPFDQLDKLYADVQAKTGFDINAILRNDNSPSWFQDISHNYLLLDMYGYQQDKIRVDAKNKDTMRNTIDDGFHAAFASTCDFYISNDSRAANKAKQVYQKLQINTRICTPGEFVVYGNQSLVYDDPQVHLNLWFQLLNSTNYIESEVDNATWRTYFLEFFLFDYFNKIFVVFAPENTVPLILLSKEKPTNYPFTSELDVIALIDKLNIAFEADGAGRIDTTRLEMTENLEFHWLYHEITYRLQLLNGYLQLYMDLPELTV